MTVVVASTSVVSGTPVSVTFPAFVGTDGTTATNTTSTPTCTYTSAIGATYSFTVSSVSTGVYKVTTSGGWPALDVLTVTLSGAISAVNVSQTVQVDVVGAQIVAPLTALTAVGGDTSNTTQVARTVRALDEFDRIVRYFKGASLVPRIAVETWNRASLDCAYRLVLSEPLPYEIVSCKVDGTAVSTLLDHSAVVRSGGGNLRPTASDGTVEVVYKHGYQTPPAEMVRAATAYVGCVLNIDAAKGRRAYLSNGPDGFTVNPDGTPDPSRGRYTGFIEVDRLIESLPDHRPVVIA